MSDHIHILRARIDMLEEENRQLRDALNPQWEAPGEMNLTASQVRILSCLLHNDRICSEMVLWLAARKPTDHRTISETNVACVHISNIRPKLARFGLEIETHKGLGYRLAPESRERLLNWPRPGAAQAA
jgi:DNA-binding response OmpR family regulator